jgi:hypothetical protein
LERVCERLEHGGLKRRQRFSSLGLNLIFEGAKLVVAGLGSTTTTNSLVEGS